MCRLPAVVKNAALYAGLGDQVKWVVDRALRRVYRLAPNLARHAPVGSVRLKGIDGPVFVRLGTSDWVVLEEIFKWGAYEALTRHPMGDVRTIVDLGANVGLSVRLWQKAFPAAKVVAVEPEPTNARMLRRNVDAGPSPRGVATVEACVAGSTRRVALDTSGGAWGVKMAADGNGKVPAMRMEEVLAAGGMGDQPIDLMKCDVEGAEAEIFADCAAWIGRVRWLAIELHPPYDKTKLVADLARNGGHFVEQHAQDWVGQEVVLLEQTGQ